MDIEKNSLVSIITPSLNSEKYIQETIESINCQTYKNIEHIVVDGGSTDGTLDIVQGYKHIQLLSEPDRGMYDAINKGIGLSSGDVLAYLNADDRYFPYSLETVVGFFLTYPDVDFIYGYCTYISENGKPLYVYRALPWMQQIVRKARYTWAQPSCFWRRRIHEKIGLFDDSLKYLADRDFFERIIEGGFKGKLVRRPLAKFMVQRASLERALTPRQITENEVLTTRYKSRKLHPFYIYNETFFKLMNIDTYFFRTFCRLRGEAII